MFGRKNVEKITREDICEIAIATYDHKKEEEKECDKVKEDGSREMQLKENEKKCLENARKSSEKKFLAQHSEIVRVLVFCGFSQSISFSVSNFMDKITDKELGKGYFINYYEVNHSDFGCWAVVKDLPTE